MVYPGYRKRTIFLLIALLLVRFWFSQTFELSGREAYLWLQGHGANLSASYWEHGPLVPLVIRIGTLFFGDTELGVRWPAAVIACTSGFILFYLARHWFDARCAFWTVILFILTPLFAWKLSFMTEAAAGIGLMALAMLAFSLAMENDHGWWWMLGGVACGLALLVALPNAWWITGPVLYFASDPGRRARLREGWLWGAVGVAAVFVVPILWWWHGPQVVDVVHSRLLNAWPLSHGFSLNQGFHFLGLEIVYLSPLFFVLLIGILWQLGRGVWKDDKYALLLSLSLPGIVWLNLTAFFHESRFELVPAVFLPLVLLAGCFMSRLTLSSRAAQIVAIVVLALAGLQSLAGLNPFYFASRGDGHGVELRRSLSGDNLTGIYANRPRISWRNLADAVQNLQRDQGATLIITDSPESASALCFYLPRNPFVYVEGKSGVISHFDFWPGYATSASPNDSALYLSHETSDRPGDPPPADVYKNFATVTKIDDPPLPESDKSWDIWSCQNFVGSGSQAASEAPASPMHESDALPK